MVTSNTILIVDHLFLLPLKNIHIQISNFLVPYTVDVYYKLKSFPYFAIVAFSILIAVKFLKWLFFGNLTIPEITTLKKKFNYTLWEFILCLIVFRMDKGSASFDKFVILNFAFLFSCVLLLKMFHYLCVYRVSNLFNSNHTHLHDEVSTNLKDKKISTFAPPKNIKNDFDDDDFDDLTTYNKNFIFSYNLFFNDEEDDGCNEISINDGLQISKSSLNFRQPKNNKMFLLHLRFGTGIFLLNFIDIILIIKFFQIVHRNYIQLNKQSDANPNTSLLILFGFEIINLYPLIILTSFNYMLKYWEFHKFSHADYSPNEKKSFRLSKQKYLLILKISLSYLKFLNQIIFSIFFIQVFCIFPLHLIPISYSSLRILIFKFRCILNLKKFELKLIYFESKLKPVNATIKSDSIGGCYMSHCNNVCLICRDELNFLPSKDNITNKNMLSEIKKLPCSHHFHRDCILQWLINSSNTCPACRTVI